MEFVVWQAANMLQAAKFLTQKQLLWKQMPGRQLRAPTNGKHASRQAGVTNGLTKSIQGCCAPPFILQHLYCLQIQAAAFLHAQASWRA